MKKIYLPVILLLWSLTSYAQNSAYYRFFYEIPGSGATQILDFKDNRLLFWRDSAYHIHQLNTDLITNIPLSKPPALAVQQDKRGWLTDGGAFITTASDTAGMVALYEWRNNTLTEIEKQATSVEIGGNYALWTSWGYFYHKRPGEEKIRVSTNPGAFTMSPQGWYLYSIDDTLYRHQNGATTPFATGEQTSERFLYVVTDSTHVMYLMNKAQQNPTLYLYNGVTTDTVAILRGVLQQVFFKQQYTLSNGYAAFVSIDNADAGWPYPTAYSTVYVRNPAGERNLAFTQIPPRGYRYARPELWGLTENGGLLFAKEDYTWQNGLHYTGWDSTSKYIARFPWSGTSQVPGYVYKDKSFYTFYNDSIYRVVPDSAYENSVKTFTVSVLADSAYHFTLQQFLDNYNGVTSGPGQMEGAGFFNGLLKGHLIVGQDTVDYRSSYVNRARLDSLVYKPLPGVSGPDSVQWVATTYVSNSTFGLIKFRIYPKLSAPVLSGLDSAYCGNGPQTVRIANYPADSLSATVRVLLDSSIQLPVNMADSTFTFNPDSLPPGQHRLSVVFQHPADSVYTSAGFRTGGSTGQAAAVTLTSNINIINNNNDTVVLTAHGNAPGLFTFARDAAFTDVLRAESADSVLRLAPAAFRRGSNNVHVRLKTSGCSADSIATDRVRIVKTGLSNIPGKDFDNKNVIITYPNPFNTQFTVEGLEPSKKYILTLHDLSGRAVLTMFVDYQHKFTVTPNVALNRGVYFLKVWDVAAQKVAGGAVLMKM